MGKLDSNRPDMRFVAQAGEAIAGVQRELHAYNVAAFPPRPPEFFALELAGECGELANKEKKIWKGRELPLEDLAEEAADVLIALMNYSNARGIDLGAAMALKMREIERRRTAE